MRLMLPQRLARAGHDQASCRTSDLLSSQARATIPLSQRHIPSAVESLGSNCRPAVGRSHADILAAPFVRERTTVSGESCKQQSCCCLLNVGLTRTRAPTATPEDDRGEKAEPRRYALLTLIRKCISAPGEGTRRKYVSRKPEAPEAYGRAPACQKRADLQQQQKTGCRT